MLNIEMPDWAQWLDVPFAEDRTPVRHRVLFGGRGGGKSWTMAQKIVERAWRGKERILCTREIQNSIRDSSKKLIEDRIERLGLSANGSGFFKITENEIRGANGSTISFMGLNGKEAAIKSLEGYTLVWVEEAASVSKSSIEALIPTIRREGSEIWWSYNPRFPYDPVDMMFRGANGPPPGSIVRAVQYNDNIWFPDVLRRDMEWDCARDIEMYRHIWEGHYLERSETQIFKNSTVFSFEAPSDALFRFGADWGFAAHPSALVRCFLGSWSGEPYASDIVADQNGRCLFVDWEVSKIGCTIDESPAFFAGTDDRLPPRWPNHYSHVGVPGAMEWLIIADSARPEIIDHMRSRGFKMQQAVKGAGSVNEGIAFLHSKDIVVHPRCKRLIDELARYSWATDRQTGAILPKPADSYNHIIDALRYAMEGARKAAKDDYHFASAGPRITSNIHGFQLGGASEAHRRAGLRRW